MHSWISIGQYPAIAEMATAMVSFLQQLQHYLPLDISPVCQNHHVELFERLTVADIPNEVCTL